MYTWSSTYGLFLAVYSGDTPDSSWETISSAENQTNLDTCKANSLPALQSVQPIYFLSYRQCATACREHEFRIKGLKMKDLPLMWESFKLPNMNKLV